MATTNQDQKDVKTSTPLHITRAALTSPATVTATGGVQVKAIPSQFAAHLNVTAATAAHASDEPKQDRNATSTRETISTEKLLESIRKEIETRKKQQIEQIEKQLLKTQSHATLTVVSAADRKTIHAWCARQPYLHIGYVNREDEKETEREEQCQYWCRTCRQWRGADDKEKTATSYCCSDEYGGQGCSDWFVYCTVCEHYEDDDDEGDRERTCIWDQGGHDNDVYKRRSWKRNNAILILKNMDVGSNENRQLYKQFGLTYRAVRRLVQRQNKRYLSPHF
jgi:hypothetical protein